MRKETKRDCILCKYVVEHFCRPITSSYNVVKHVSLTTDNVSIIVEEPCFLLVEAGAGTDLGY